MSAIYQLRTKENYDWERYFSLVILKSQYLLHIDENMYTHIMLGYMFKYTNVLLSDNTGTILHTITKYFFFLYMCIVILINVFIINFIFMNQTLH